VTESGLKLEKPKKIPDANEVSQDPMVRQALNKLKSWGKSSVSRATENRLLRKKRAAGTSSLEEETS
jgi:hypothetical protein